MDGNYLTTIRTNAEHSFHISYPAKDSLSSSKMFACATMYPKSDWFALKLEDKGAVHIHLNEWEDLKRHVEALIEAAKAPINLP